MPTQFCSLRVFVIPTWSDDRRDVVKTTALPWNLTRCVLRARLQITESKTALDAKPRSRSGRSAAVSCGRRRRRTSHQFDRSADGSLSSLHAISAAWPRHSISCRRDDRQQSLNYRLPRSAIVPRCAVRIELEELTPRRVHIFRIVFIARTSEYFAGPSVRPPTEPLRRFIGDKPDFAISSFDRRLRSYDTGRRPDGGCQLSHAIVCDCHLLGRVISHEVVSKTPLKNTSVTYEGGSKCFEFPHEGGVTNRNYNNYYTTLHLLHFTSITTT